MEDDVVCLDSDYSYFDGDGSGSALQGDLPTDEVPSDEVAGVNGTNCLIQDFMQHQGPGYIVEMLERELPADVPTSKNNHPNPDL